MGALKQLLIEVDSLKAENKELLKEIKKLKAELQKEYEQTDNLPY